MGKGSKRDNGQQLSERSGGPVRFYRGAERRAKPRINEAFSATVRGVNADGKAFEIYTHLQNLSRGGLCFRMAQQVFERSKLFIVIRLSTDPDENKPAARVAIRAVVLRAELQPDDLLEVAAKIAQFRFLSRKDLDIR